MITRMLDKDPGSRATIEELVREDWLNREEVPLVEFEDEVVEVTHADIRDAIRPVTGIFFAKRYGKKWINSVKSHRTF